MRRSFFYNRWGGGGLLLFGVQSQWKSFLTVKVRGMNYLSAVCQIFSNATSQSVVSRALSFCGDYYTRFLLLLLFFFLVGENEPSA